MLVADILACQRMVSSIYILFHLRLSGMFNTKYFYFKLVHTLKDKEVFNIVRYTALTFQAPTQL